MPVLPTSTPNIVLFLTDQQRSLQFFPKKWADANLANLNALKNTGLTFTNAIINTARCSPSRGVLTTSLYAPKNQLEVVDGTLSPTWKTLGAWLQVLTGDYQVGYVGKWHMTANFLTAAQTVPNCPSTLASQNACLNTEYRTPGWDAPDAGTALGWAYSCPPADPTCENPYVSNSNTLGGGPGSFNRNDQRIALDAIHFLKNIDSSRPFALIVSLVNPHDVTRALPAQFDGRIDLSQILRLFDLPR